MKKGEHYLGTIERVDFPNKGIAFVEDTQCVIKNTIPGQEVEFQVSKKRNGKVEGRLLGVVNKAPNEIASPCPHFGICGGCTYINLEYDDQLRLKESQVKRLLDAALVNQKEEWEFLQIKGSPKAYEYRNKMEFSFGDNYKGGPLALGMHKRGSFYDIETVSECRLVDDDYRSILKFTLEEFKDCSFHHKQRHEGWLRHLLVRKAAKTGEIMIALVTSSSPWAIREENINVDSGNVKQLSVNNDSSKRVMKWKEGIMNLPLNGRVVSLLQIVNDSLADVVQADSINVLFGNEHITEELLGLKFDISTFSFFQTNTLGAEVLYETVREFIGNIESDDPEGPIVYDLYSGTGTITQMMAPVCKKIYGVEIVEEAVVKARENAKINGLNNCEFIAGDVLKVLDDIEERPDFIILDPPRDGVHPKALSKIIDYGVDRLIYIACKPTSLCRDIEDFLLAGYRVEKAVCVDMFPNTANVETVCLLSKLHEAKHHVSVKLDMDPME
ncbi:MAG: 23S rRNA (uracil(1939)-C(5))-methyltransferase RlmD [Lachnospiraceae bacterium]|nr:23S rRNA (uracil(1939)-C(5))-methyltransferase RlmD [Lachnospiraceae bacterium]